MRPSPPKNLLPILRPDFGLLPSSPSSVEFPQLTSGQRSPDAAAKGRGFVPRVWHDARSRTLVKPRRGRCTRARARVYRFRAISAGESNNAVVQKGGRFNSQWDGFFVFFFFVPRVFNFRFSEADIAPGVFEARRVYVRFERTQRGERYLINAFS